MIFKLNIANKANQQIFSDLFHLDSINELVEKCYTLKNDKLQETPPLSGDYFRINITTINNLKVIDKYISNIFLLQTIKNNIYAVIVKKILEYEQQNSLHPIIPIKKKEPF